MRNMAILKRSIGLLPAGSWKLAVPVALAAMMLGTSAIAQVLQIGDDGEVTRFEGPTLFTLEDAQALIATPEPVAEHDGMQVRREISAAATAYGLDSRLVEAVAWRESRFSQTARSPKGATGVMQLMPGTARDLGVDASNLTQNIRGGTLYLRQMLGQFGGDVKLALAAYNAGPAAVRKHGGVPPYAETQAYVAAILGRMAATGAALTVPALGASN
jgi:soluble lytic murein transglycosylase-like protein